MAYARKFLITHDPAALSLAGKNAQLAAANNPESAKAKLSVAVVHVLSGKTQQAIPELAAALLADPGNPEIRIYQARAFRDLGQASNEEKVYRQILNVRPNFWPAYNELGWFLYRHGRYEDAAEEFSRASAVAPRVALPLTNLGTMYLALHRKNDAIDAFRRSLERAPNQLAYLNLGSIQFEDGDYRKALEYYQKARDLKPADDQTWRDIADCYTQLHQPKLVAENYKKAADLLNDKLQANPRNGPGWMTMGFYEAKLGRSAAAEADLKTAEERGAADLQSQFTKAQALAVLGQKKEALELVLACLGKGLSTVEVDLAVDLDELRSDPKYKQYVAQLQAKTAKPG